MKQLIVLSLALMAFSCRSNKEYGIGVSTHIWAQSIHNPDNEEFVVEVAFNEGVSVDEVTQEMFNKRYKQN